MEEVEDDIDLSGRPHCTLFDFMLGKQTRRLTKQQEQNMINENVIKGKWQQIKGEVQKAYGRLTNDELEATKGDMNSIAGLVQQRYGEAREDFDARISAIADKFKDQKDEATDEIKRKLS